MTRPIDTPNETPLESWKAIAAYLGRDARTVMRWEKAEGLPIRRHRHLTRSSVYAYPSELDRWRAGRTTELESLSRRRLWLGLAFATTLVFVTSAAGGGRFVGPLARLQTGLVDRPLPSAGMAAPAVLSSDSRFVAYIDQLTRELALRSIADGRDVQVTTIAKEGGFVDSPVLSPDGRFVAFAATSKDRQARGLHILPLDGDLPRSASPVLGGGWHVPKDWFQDQKRLAIVTERADGQFEIGVFEVAPRTLRSLATLDFPGPGSQVVASPDGRFIAFDARPEPGQRDRDLYVIATDTGEARPILRTPASEMVVGWAADGRLIHLSDRPNSQGSGLWAQALDDTGRAAGDATLLLSGFDGDPMNLTRRGTLLYVQARRENELLTVGIDRQRRTVTDSVSAATHDRSASSRRPRWSANGEVFLYETNRPTGPVWAIQSRDGVVREVPLRLSYIWTFDVSPDGRRIVCRGRDAENRTGIFLFDTTSGAVTSLVLWDGTRQFVPQFSRDGAHVTYIQGATIVQQNLQTRAVTVLARIPPGGAGALRRSPNERYLLRAAAAGSSRTALEVVDLETERARQIFSIDRSMAITTEDGAMWMPDSTAVVVNIRGAEDNHRELWWIPVEPAGEPQRIDLGPLQLTNSAIAISPDGRTLALLSGDPVPSRTSAPKMEFRLLERFFAALPSAR